jgi:DNA-directed RNA polymerase omega subunit
MNDTQKAANNSMSKTANEELWPGIESRFLLVLVAAQRNKQLLKGSLPRIEDQPVKARNVRIALEEIKHGLVPFTFDQ